MITQLGYVGVGVKDINKWEDFATGILGLEVSERLSDGTLYLRMDEYHHRFIVYPNGNDDVAYVGWMVPTVGALEELNAKLQSAGVRVEQASKGERENRKVVDLIKFNDPSGLRLEVFYGLQVLSNQPFQPSRPISGFKTGELGIGHVVLSVKDIDEATSFYRDLLGFRISDYVDSKALGPGKVLRLVFFHCNPRHHSLAFGELPAPRRLAHFMLELKSLDDVGLTYDLCYEKGITIASTLGKHSNDHMLSFYMVSPSGFEVEYGFGARVVDDSTWVVQYHQAGNIWGHKRSISVSGARMPARES